MGISCVPFVAECPWPQKKMDQLMLHRTPSTLTRSIEMPLFSPILWVSDDTSFPERQILVVQLHF